MRGVLLFGKNCQLLSYRVDNTHLARFVFMLIIIGLQHLIVKGIMEVFIIEESRRLHLVNVDIDCKAEGLSKVHLLFCDSNEYAFR